uniref:Uncharacterized protein n=1 Tax=uncultured marine virus TaxID=186617 RepID=A0A0F7L416_9VIRU|nr:hypothetical protein [uncultured marine virus]
MRPNSREGINIHPLNAITTHSIRCFYLLLKGYALIKFARPVFHAHQPMRSTFKQCSTPIGKS